jgi:hypothetical protein
MNMSFVLIGFSLAVIMGAAFAALLSQLRPFWSEKKRLLAAGSGLPLVTIAATVAGIAFILVEGGGAEDGMRDLAISALGTLGGFFAVVAFAGGLVGAALAQRRRRR